MIRARALRVALLLAAVALPAGLFAAPADAASGAFLLHEANGSFAVGAPNLTVDSPVVETASGRQLFFPFVQTGPNGNPEVELQLKADTTECVAAAANRVDVVLHHCDGGLGTVWIEHTNDNGKKQYEPREFRGLFLAGHNQPTGTQFQLKSLTNGAWFHNFDKIAVPPQP
jgi:hypothetical protein